MRHYVLNLRGSSKLWHFINIHTFFGSYSLHDVFASTAHVAILQTAEKFWINHKFGHIESTSFALDSRKMYENRNELHRNIGFENLSNTDTSFNMSTESRVVRFDSVVVREYEIILGDNPSVSDGAPISLGWNYTSMEPIELDDYEIMQIYSKASRPSRCFMMPSSQRTSLLRNAGFTEKEIVDAAMEVKRIRKRRRAPMKKLSLSRGAKFLKRKLSTIHDSLSFESGRDEIKEKFHIFA